MLFRSKEVSYGILAAKIIDGATFEGVTLSNSALILTDKYFEGVQSASIINLISPAGNTSAISLSNCVCTTSEGSGYADSYTITVSPDGTVTVTLRENGGEGAGDQNS